MSNFYENIVYRLHTRKRRKSLYDGFTIVELLIVIVVIAILAAIVIVSYNGITARSIDASMRSDLKNAATTVELDKVKTGSYPANSSSANGGNGLTSSDGATLTYILEGNGFCIGISHIRAAVQLRLRNSGLIEEGACAATVTTLAGSGTGGSADGSGTSAQFFYPMGIDTDNAGNVYVADSDNFAIRKISPSGEVTTFAGGTRGTADGTGAAAQFWYPQDVVVASDGTVYVADVHHSVREISPSGVVTTLAGVTGSSLGTADGTGAAAQFNSIYGITIGPDDVIYVADTNRIRKVTRAGVVTSFVGSPTGGYADGTGTAARFSRVTDLEFGPDGMLYAVDANNGRIRKVTPGGVVTTVAGDGGSGYIEGPGLTARFSTIAGIAIDDAGILFITDQYNYRIRTMDLNNVVSTFAGMEGWGYVDGVRTAAQFTSPLGITIAQDGTMYVSEYDDHRIRKIK